MGKNKVVAEMAKKVMKKLKEEVEKNGLKLFMTEDGKEGKSKMIASCGFLENELRQFSREEGVTMADSMETLGVDLRRRIKKLGAEEQARRQVEILDYQEESFSTELHESGSQECATSGHDASKNLESTCSGFGPYRKIEIEKADGSSSRQKEDDFSVFVYGSIWLGSRGGTVHRSQSVLGRKSLDRRMAS